MSILPHKNKTSDNSDDTGADKPVVARFGQRIFFVVGKPGCGKSTFLAALIQKFNLQPSGFITKKEEAVSEPALYMHQVLNGITQFRYEADNRAGICCPPKPVGFTPVFDVYGLMCLKQAEKAVRSSASDDADTIEKDNCTPVQSFDIDGAGALRRQHMPVILMDELGVMEAESELFFHTVCAVFSNPRYSIIGAVKPRGTRFLPVLERMPEAAVFHLTLQNRPQLYARLEQAQSFAAFLHAVVGEFQTGKNDTE